MARGRGPDKRCGGVLVLLALGLQGCVLFPPSVYYSVQLIPELASAPPEYAAGDRNTVSYYVQQSRIDVRHLSDQELNAMFPDDSRGGRLSTNPYTYGDWVDPDLGYTPNRFTVFEISVQNTALPRMLVDPLKARLRTDRGQVLEAYTVSPTANRKSLEGYYRALRRVSGNEYYRFAKRIGTVKGTIYSSDEVIFKGERYSGLIVFDPMDPRTSSAQLTLNVGTELDAFNRPVQTVDVPFTFGRRVEQYTIQGKQPAAKALTRVVVHGPQDISGNQPGDLARNVGAVNSVVNDNLTDLNRCFAAAYVQGQATAGTVNLQFVVQVNGEVTDVRVLESTVASSAVEQCITDEVNRWRFQLAGAFVAEPATAARGGGVEPDGAMAAQVEHGQLLPVVVVYPLGFEGAE